MDKTGKALHNRLMDTRHLYHNEFARSLSLQNAMNSSHEYHDLWMPSPITNRLKLKTKKDNRRISHENSKMVCSIFREKSSYSFQDFLRRDKYFPKVAHSSERKNEVHDKLSFFHTLNDRNWKNTKK